MSAPATPVEAPAANPEAAAPEAGLLDQILDRFKPVDERERARNKSALDEFIRSVVPRGQVVPDDVEANIKSVIAQLDRKLSDQVNEVLHQPKFQRLEGTWRGLKYLVDQSASAEGLKLKVLNVSKDDLLRDLERAVEFDQSALFKKVYEQEYGTL